MKLFEEFSPTEMSKEILFVLYGYTDLEQFVTTVSYNDFIEFHHTSMLYQSKGIQNIDVWITKRLHQMELQYEFNSLIDMINSCDTSGKIHKIAIEQCINLFKFTMDEFCYICHKYLNPTVKKYKNRTSYTYNFGVTRLRKIDYGNRVKWYWDTDKLWIPDEDDPEGGFWSPKSSDNISRNIYADCEHDIFTRLSYYYVEV